MNQVSATFHGLNFWSNPRGELNLFGFGFAASQVLAGATLGGVSTVRQFECVVLALINAACWFALRNRPV